MERLTKREKDGVEAHLANLRPCSLVSGREAVFHKWIEKARIVDPSPMMGGHDGGVIRYTVGIVEYENGEVHECYPTEIRFTDRKES